MKLRKLCEEFVDAVRFSEDWYYEIFKNPTSKEISAAKSKELGVRFIIDFEKEIFYVFSDELLHKFAAKKLGLIYSYPNWGNMEFGYGIGNVIGGRKVKCFLRDLETNDNRKKEIKDGKHNWLDKYIGFIRPRIR